MADERFERLKKIMHVVESRATPSSQGLFPLTPPLNVIY